MKTLMTCLKILNFFMLLCTFGLSNIERNGRKGSINGQDDFYHQETKKLSSICRSETMEEEHLDDFGPPLSLEVFPAVHSNHLLVCKSYSGSHHQGKFFKPIELLWCELLLLIGLDYLDQKNYQHGFHHQVIGVSTDLCHFQAVLPSHVLLARA